MIQAQSATEDLKIPGTVAQEARDIHSTAASARPSSSANAASSAVIPRIAYFPDSFHEVNGVAHTSRHFEAFARRRNLPFLCVRAGEREQSLA
ncbi:MAG TPA: hypothetical protein VMD29_14170, partial [Terracidiphilus sp.]|nr:hypothetical protein [Terracidiphilus sp.]